MDSAEYAEWAAYERIEPWGQRPDYWRAAMLAQSLWAVHGVRRQMKEFLPAEPVKQQTPEEVYAVLKAAFGG